MKAYIMDRYVDNRRQVCIVLANDDAEAMGVVVKKFGSNKKDWSDWGVSSSTDASIPKWIFNTYT